MKSVALFVALFLAACAQQGPAPVHTAASTHGAIRQFCESDTEIVASGGAPRCACFADALWRGLGPADQDAVVGLMNGPPKTAPGPGLRSRLLAAMERGGSECRGPSVRNLSDAMDRFFLQAWRDHLALPPGYTAPPPGQSVGWQLVSSPANCRHLLVSRASYSTAKADETCRCAADHLNKNLTQRDLVEAGKGMEATATPEQKAAFARGQRVIEAARQSCAWPLPPG